LTGKCRTTVERNKNFLELIKKTKMKTETYKTLFELEEYFLAGFYENKFESYQRRFGKAIKLYAENAGSCEYENTVLYPAGSSNLWNLIPDSSAGFSYSYTMVFRKDQFLKKMDTLSDERQQYLMQIVDRDLAKISQTCITQQYCCGGNGYTHSMINYGRILKDGLVEYESRIRSKLEETEDEEKRDFYSSLLIALESVLILHKKHLEKLRSIANPDSKLQKLILAMENVPLKPAKSFYEAMVATNFMWYIDDADSIGRFDQFLYPYFKKDMDDGVISREEVAEILKELWHSFDCRGGWHMILGGSNNDSSSAYQDLTLLCLETIQKCRRPNTGLRVRPDMPDEIWQAVLDSMASGCGHPSLYNEDVYASGVRSILKVDKKDEHNFAYGGCTEIMVQGMSNVGSIDAGFNLLEIMENFLPNLTEYNNFDAFFKDFLCKVKETVDMSIAQSNLNQQYMSIYRPQPIRSLFIDDCIDRGLDYNAGGARYNGSVINVVAFANAINSLFTIKQVLEENIPITPVKLLQMLENDYSGFNNEHQIIKGLDKYGCNIVEVNEIAQKLTGFVFDKILSHKCYRGNGFCVPSTIMFVTYANEGADIGATPDGRKAYSPVSDSYGPMQGTDKDGPTSTILSTAGTPQYKGLGTLVLNLRIDKKMFKDKESRNKVISILKSYFAKGGLMIQVTVADSAILKDAIKNPEKYNDLIIRIGGYSEYFTRLSPILQHEVMNRTEIDC